MDVIVVACCLAALKPDLLVVEVEAQLQVRLDEDATDLRRVG